jgi:ABC-type Fe3+-hydroxamate transport system substrate-binding protein
VRIVSLVPSVTETLACWSRDPIACTRFCERGDLEHVGGTKDPHVERIARLAPDLVVMEAEENRREDYDELVARGLAVLALHVRSLADLDAAMGELAAAVGGSWRHLDLTEDPAPPRSAFVPIWRRPWRALGAPTYGTSLLAHLGVGNVYDGDGPYPAVELAEAAARRPDVVLAPSEPYPFSERQRVELEPVAPTLFVDGKDLFWWGARTPGALARLRDVLASA